MIQVGFIGWRGLVGSVLLERMKKEGDFVGFTPRFASTSQAGTTGPAVGIPTPPVIDAHNIDALCGMDILVSCQGSDYSKEVYPALVKAGFKGYWLDASSAFRMDSDAVIVLDPVNHELIHRALAANTKKFIGGNCTVSLMLMALHGLFQNNLVDWLSTMTYQAASGAGAKNMRELVDQMAFVGEQTTALRQTDVSALDLDAAVLRAMTHAGFPTSNFGFPLVGSVLPWIDREVEGGQSKEEWKGFAETNKILGTIKPVPVDGICVRVGAMRCHSQALTIKLREDLPLPELERLIGGANDWVRVIPNTKQETLSQLTPTAVSGKLIVPIGRLRKLNLGQGYLGAFTVGDQLLWGAAEPIRRMLNLILEHLR